MLQSMRSQRVGHDLAIEQQQCGRGCRVENSKWWEFTRGCFWLTNTITPGEMAFSRREEMFNLFFTRFEIK